MAAAAPRAAEPTVFRDALADERPRRPLLPVAILLVIGMLIAFAAGWVVRGRSEPAGTASAPVAAQPQAAAPAPAPGQPQAGKAWSEQQVTRPPQAAGPPPVPAETAAPVAARKPAAAAATRGTMTVQSTPSGASVTVNGRWRGRTPLTLEDLRFGPYTVRIVRSGYAVAREEFTLSAHEPDRTLSVRLRRAVTPPQPVASSTQPSGRPAVGTGSIYVDSRPRGARVFVDGRAAGVTPLRLGDVRAGSHTVRLELVDHRAWTDRRYVLAGQETRVTGSLERIR